MADLISSSLLGTFADMAMDITLQGGTPYTSIEVRSYGIAIRMRKARYGLEKLVLWSELASLSDDVDISCIFKTMTDEMQYKTGAKT